MRYLIFALAFILCSCKVKYKAVCKTVLDGDSFYLINHKEVRIFGCDSPEWTHGHDQPFGDVAKEFTRHLIEGKEITLIVMDQDKYKREVDKVVLSDGSDLSELLVRAGLAFTYPKYSPKYLHDEQETAKINHVGLWVQDNPETPSHFRNRLKN